MKKIIAFLSAVVMVMSMFATVSFAADNEVVFNTTVKDSTVTIDLSVNTTYTDIQTIGMFLDMSDALAKGGTVTAANGDATVKYVGQQKMVSVAFAPTDAHKYVSGTVLGTITITGVSDNFAISMMPITNRTTTKITSAGSGEVTSAFGTIGTSVVVKAADDKETHYYEATVAANKATGYWFDIADVTANLESVPTEVYSFGSEIAAAEGVTVGLAIEGVPAKHVLSVKAHLETVK